MKKQVGCFTIVASMNITQNGFPHILIASHIACFEYGLIQMWLASHMAILKL